jgi:hypothetical protein
VARCSNRNQAASTAIGYEIHQSHKLEEAFDASDFHRYRFGGFYGHA